MLQLLSDDELRNTPVGSAFTFDVECYPNYFLIGFRCETTGKLVFFEQSPDSTIHLPKLNWMLGRFLLFGFNSNHYDLPMLTCALQGWSTAQLKAANDRIIKGGLEWWEVERALDIQIPTHLNHVDLFQVDTVSGSCGHGLKTRAAQLLHRTIDNLPIDPDKLLVSAEQAQRIKEYNAIDLEVTSTWRASLKKELALREHMGQRYGIDLRSKSNAQIGEAVLGESIKRLTGKKPQKPREKVTCVTYDPPPWMWFKHEHLDRLLQRVCATEFIVQENGSIAAPEWMKELIPIGEAHYQMGVGGLHSTEKSVSYISNDTHTLIDRDVASYYPAIILGQELFPPSCGKEAFQSVYKQIVVDRLAAKRSGDKQTADSLKIVINGSFGKLCSHFSFLYAPKAFLQVVITGQLALMMLIERLEGIGVPIVSANTDGLIQWCPHTKRHAANVIISEWEKETGFETEETVYKALYSQDVNNYLAVKEKGSKGKGALANPWAEEGSGERFAKVPSCLVVKDAVTAFLEHRRPIEETIRACQDPARFTFCRSVKGGGSFAGHPLGKIVRWYLSRTSRDAILTPEGSKVAESEHCRPMMILPDSLPGDLDHRRYIERANELLDRVGFNFKRQLTLW